MPEVVWYFTLKYIFLKAVSLKPETNYTAGVCSHFAYPLQRKLFNVIIIMFNCLFYNVTFLHHHLNHNLGTANCYLATAADHLLIATYPLVTAIWYLTSITYNLAGTSCYLAAATSHLAVLIIWQPTNIISRPPLIVSRPLLSIWRPPDNKL